MERWKRYLLDWRRPRLSEKMTTKKKKKANEMDSSLFPTNFCEMTQKSPPPAPPALLRFAGRPTPTCTSAKVKVMLRICPVVTESSHQYLCIDNRKRQVTVYDPASSGITTAANRRNVSSAPKTFYFDAIFSQDDSLAEMCASSLTEIIQSVITGTDGCLFCYGHARLGKTYTMIGVDNHPQNMGVIPCAIAWLFRLIEEEKEKTGARFSVRVSAVEVTGQQERLKDLLAHVANGQESGGNTAPGVYLRDDPITGTQLENQSELRAPNAERAAYYLDAAVAARTLPESEEDARNSHLLFTLHVYQYRVEKSAKGVAGGRSRLHLLDLGSCGKSKDGKALSLSALGTVIMSLLNGQRHVPYRDSKLTQLIRDALGNMSCRACMICHVSPSVQAYNETLQVIQMAAKAHRMKRRKIKNFSSGSSDDSSCDGSFRSRMRVGIRMGTLREGPYSSSFSSDPESSEQSCDTVIYVGQNGRALSDKELTDNESPPAVVPMMLKPISLQEDVTPTRERLPLSSTLPSRAIGEAAILKQEVVSPHHEAFTPHQTSSVKHVMHQSPYPVNYAQIMPNMMPPTAVMSETNSEQWIDGPNNGYSNPPPVGFPAPIPLHTPMPVHAPIPLQTSLASNVSMHIPSRHITMPLTSVMTLVGPPQSSPLHHPIKTNESWNDARSYSPNQMHSSPSRMPQGNPTHQWKHKQTHGQTDTSLTTRHWASTSRTSTSVIPNNGELWVDGPQEFLQPRYTDPRKPLDTSNPPHEHQMWTEMAKPTTKKQSLENSPRHQSPKQSSHLNDLKLHSSPKHPTSRHQLRVGEESSTAEQLSFVSEWVKNHSAVQTEEEQPHHRTKHSHKHSASPRHHHDSPKPSKHHRDSPRKLRFQTVEADHKGDPLSPRTLKKLKRSALPPSITSNTNARCKAWLQSVEQAGAKGTMKKDTKFKKDSLADNKHVLECDQFKPDDDDNMPPPYEDCVADDAIPDVEFAYYESEVVQQPMLSVSPDGDAKLDNLEAGCTDKQREAEEDCTLVIDNMETCEASVKCSQPSIICNEDEIIITQCFSDVRVSLPEDEVTEPNIETRECETLPPPPLDNMPDETSSNINSVAGSGSLVTDRQPPETSVLDSSMECEEIVVSVNGSMYERKFDEMFDSRAADSWKNCFTSEDEGSSVSSATEKQNKTIEQSCDNGLEHLCVDDITVNDCIKDREKRNIAHQILSTTPALDKTIQDVTIPSNCDHNVSNVDISLPNLARTHPSCLRCPDGASNPDLMMDPTNPFLSNQELPSQNPVIVQSSQPMPDSSDVLAKSSELISAKETSQWTLRSKPSLIAKPVSKLPPKTSTKKSFLPSRQSSLPKPSSGKRSTKAEEKGKSDEHQTPKMDEKQKTSKLFSKTSGSKSCDSSPTKLPAKDKSRHDKKSKSLITSPVSTPSSNRSTKSAFARLTTATFSKSGKEQKNARPKSPVSSKLSKLPVSKTLTSEKAKSIDKTKSSDKTKANDRNSNQEMYKEETKTNRGTDSDSGNDSGIVKNDKRKKKMLSPYSTVTHPRVSNHSSSGHGSEISSTFSSNQLCGMSPGAILTNEAMSSGYETFRDSEATPSSALDTTSESSGVNPSKLTVHRNVVTSNQNSPSSTIRFPTSPKVWKQSRFQQHQVHVEKKEASSTSYDVTDCTSQHRRCQEEIDLKTVEKRRQRVRDLLIQQELLKAELLESKGRLMVNRESWSFDLYVAEQADHDDLNYLEALEKETAILEKRVEACKSRIMMVTCFDVSNNN